MNNDDFHTLLEGRIDKIRRVLDKKANEYAFGADRLSNFKRAAQIQNMNPSQIAINFFMKHFVSIQDMVESRGAYESSQWGEKIGDAINYLILLEALVAEPMSGYTTRTLPINDASGEFRDR